LGRGFSSSSSYVYLLGDSRAESERLRRQAELWDPVAHALFDRLRVKRGMRVLEIGPGRGSLHLELRRRVRGPVDAVERSERFVQHLGVVTRRDGFGPGVFWQGDLIDAALPDGRYDLVFARWVFLFLPDPEAHLRKLVRALKPGGRIAIEDYLRGSMALVPYPPEWDDFARADRAFFATQGGDANIGGRLPELYRRVGLTVEEAVPTTRMGHPGSPAWKWMTEYFLGVMERYGELPPFTPEGAERLRKRWLAAQRQKTSFVIGPTVLDVVGRKRR
jgi:SAM-dependent methyltransferase